MRLPGGIFAVALAGALASACSSCEKKKDPPAKPVVATPEWLRGELPAEVGLGTPRRGGVLTMRIWIEPAGLNPLHDQMAEGWMSRYLTGTVYESLAELDRDTHPRYELKPLLAESWTESPDGLTLTVKLRRGVRFHNGEPFTSRDLEAVLQAVLEPKNLTARTRSYFTSLDRYEAPDDHTFVVRWKQPYYFLANRNFLTALPMMPASALKGDFDKLAIHRAPIGTGPFKFVSWESNHSVTFERHDGYWGQKPYLDRVVARFVKDHTVATQLWQKGEFDLMTMIQPPVWRSIEKPDPKNEWAMRGYHRVFFLENVYTWIGWNQERPFFADPRVRRALGMFYPYEQVAKNIDMDLELPTTCPYYRDSESCDPTVRRLSYDPPAARRLLEAAGWRDTNGDGVLDKDGVPFKFTFLSNPHSVRLGKLLPLLQEELRKSGIEMDIEKAESAQYMARLRSHQFDAAALGWSSLDPQQDNYQMFHSSQAEGGSNYVSFRSEAADRLLEEIRTELEPARRADKERALHRLLYDEQVYLFMTNRPFLDAVKTHVRGIKPSLAWYDLRKIWIEPSN